MKIQTFPFKKIHWKRHLQKVGHFVGMYSIPYQTCIDTLAGLECITHRDIVYILEQSRRYIFGLWQVLTRHQKARIYAILPAGDRWKICFNKWQHTERLVGANIYSAYSVVFDFQLRSVEPKYFLPQSLGVRLGRRVCCCAQIVKGLGLTSIRHRSDAKISYRGIFYICEVPWLVTPYLQ